MGELMLRLAGVRFPARKRDPLTSVRLALGLCAVAAWGACLLAWSARHG